MSPKKNMKFEAKYWPHNAQTVLDFSTARRKDWVYDEWRDTGHTPMLQSPDAFVRRVDRWCTGRA